MSVGAPFLLANVANILVCHKQGVAPVNMGIKKYLFSSVLGWGIGVLLFIFLSIFLNISADGLIKKNLLEPFLAICSPQLELGSKLFGQNPILVLPFMGFCWGCLSMTVVLLGVAFVSLVKKQH